MIVLDLTKLKQSHLFMKSIMKQLKGKDFLHVISSGHQCLQVS